MEAFTTTAPPSGKGKWSDLARRAITVILTIPALLALALWGPPGAWAIVVGFAIAIAGAECMTLLSKERRFARAVAGAVASTTSACVLLFAESAALATLGALAIMSIAGFLLVILRSTARSEHGRAIYTMLLHVCFTAFYCGILPAHIALIRRDIGGIWTVFAIVVVWGSDVGAYLLGKLLGGPKLAPQVSPRKTISGAIGGLIAAAAIGFAFLLYDGAGPILFVVIAFVAGVLSMLGDLIESHLKRRAGAKDSGLIIPGHGGMLDCIDGLILAAPFLYYALRHLLITASH